MAEWSNAAVSKTVVRLPANRGFESPSLRKGNTNHPPEKADGFYFQAVRSKFILKRKGLKIKKPAKRVCVAFAGSHPGITPERSEGVIPCV
jgi:hypothetical protein